MKKWNRQAATLRWRTRLMRDEGNAGYALNQAGTVLNWVSLALAVTNHHDWALVADITARLLRCAARETTQPRRAAKTCSDLSLPRMEEVLEKTSDDES